MEVLLFLNFCFLQVRSRAVNAFPSALISPTQLGIGVIEHNDVPRDFQVSLAALSGVFLEKRQGLGRRGAGSGWRRVGRRIRNRDLVGLMPILFADGGNQQCIRKCSWAIKFGSLAFVCSYCRCLPLFSG